MENVFRPLLDHRKLAVVFFLAIGIICAIAQGAVKVNENFSAYLPPDSPSTVGLNKMNEVFDEAVPNTRLLVGELSVGDARGLANSLAKLDGVEGVMWLGKYD